METLEQQFDSRVRVFLGRTGVSPTTFGMKALGDPNLMRQLDGGRLLSLRTADRVLAFVADYDLDSGGPRTPPRGHRRWKPSSRARRTRRSRAMSEQPIEQRTNPGRVGASGGASAGGAGAEDPLDPAARPILDARLGDGSRVAICTPPAAPEVAITIRRFGGRAFSPEDLVRLGSLPEAVLREAKRVLRARRNILVSGGTGSGKTTLLNALIELLPEEERIVAIEDTLELRIERANCLRFEAGAVGSETPVSIRDLVRHALRHRPDHIVVGEVRGAEAADLLQALNTGHGGSLTTVHANNVSSALSRLASCAMQAGGALPWEVTCRGVVDGIHLVVHMTRRGGRRFVEEAIGVRSYDAAANRWLTEPVWRKHDQSTTEVSREDEQQTKE